MSWGENLLTYQGQTSLQKNIISIILFYIFVSLIYTFCPISATTFTIDQLTFTHLKLKISNPACSPVVSQIADLRAKKSFKIQPFDFFHLHDFLVSRISLIVKMLSQILIGNFFIDSCKFYWSFYPFTLGCDLHSCLIIGELKINICGEIYQTKIHSDWIFASSKKIRILSLKTFQQTLNTDLQYEVFMPLTGFVGTNVCYFIKSYN